MAHVDLCSGIGGFALGFEWAGLSKPVLFCDIEPWSRKILKKHWPDVPIAEDVKELADDPDRYVPRNLDWSNTILTAGYPCQPFSVAGRQRGTEDPRHIWPWLHKLVALKRPKFAVFENVVGHIALGLDKVLNDLEGEDYSIATLIIPASAVGAPHKRERLWIIAANMANTKSQQRNERHSRISTQKSEQSGLRIETGTSNGSSNVANTDNEGSQRGVQGRQNTQRQGIDGITRCSGATHGQPEEREQTAQPRMGRVASRLSTGLDRFGRHEGFEGEPADIPRVASGIKDRSNRLKGLGNAIVPGIAMQIGLAIKESQWK